MHEVGAPYLMSFTAGEMWEGIVLVICQINKVEIQEEKNDEKRKWANDCC